MRLHRRHHGGSARTPVGLAGLVGLVLVVATACGGLGPEPEPRAIDTTDIPDALLDPGPGARPDLDAGAAGVPADLFLVLPAPGGRSADEVLVPCRLSTAAGGSVEARSRAVIERLVNLVPAGEAECPDETLNAVPADLLVLSVRVVFAPGGNVLELNVSKDALSAIESTQQRRAIAQLVFTATEVPGVSAVRFFADGEPISVPVEDGTAASGDAVSPRDFPRLARALEEQRTPAPSDTTTTAPGPEQPPVP